MDAKVELVADLCQLRTHLRHEDEDEAADLVDRAITALEASADAPTEAIDPDALTGCADDQTWADVPVEALRAAIAPVQDDDAELIESLRKVAPKWKEGQSNEFALFDMANLNLWDLNALINRAADRIEALSRLTPTADHSLVEALKQIVATLDGSSEELEDFNVLIDRALAIAESALAGKQSVEGQE